MTISEPENPPNPPKPPKPPHKYTLMFLPDALAEYRALDGSVRTHVKKLLGKRLQTPHVPGGALHGDLSNCYKIKLLKQGIRLIYQVEDDRLIVLVLAVDKREDSLAYKSAVARLEAAAVVLSKTSTSNSNTNRKKQAR